MRTTSPVEAVNSVIQRSFPKQTSIFKFTESLKLHESIKATDLYQLEKNDVISPHLERRRKEDRARDEKIRKWSALLNNNEITVTKFLEEMSKKELLPSNFCKSEEDDN